MPFWSNRIYKYLSCYIYSGESSDWNGFKVITITVDAFDTWLSPIYTLGTTYVDDAAPRSSAPVYVSVVYLIGAIGPAAGYILGGVVVKFWVDVTAEPLVAESDSRWVGQWWAGFLLASLMLVLTSLPLFLFKASPPSDHKPIEVISNTDDDSEVNQELINNSTGMHWYFFLSKSWLN